MQLIRNHQFWLAQAKAAWRSQAQRRISQKLIEAVRILGRIGQRMIQHRQAMSGGFIEPSSKERATVILLNWARPRNLQVILDRILESQFVERVVISNNCRDYAMSDFVETDDPRVHLQDEQEYCAVGNRYLIAKEFSSDYFLTIDDDIFLTPKQAWQLFRAVVEQPSCVHGIQGACYQGGAAQRENPWPFKKGIHQQELEVDILNNAYAFTREHLMEFHHLASLAGVAQVRVFSNCDDIVLSGCGKSRPQVHDLGAIWRCATSSTPGIALHTTSPDFYQVRWEMFCQVQQLSRHGLSIRLG